jgi:hypothetical protein
MRLQARPAAPIAWPVAILRKCPENGPYSDLLRSIVENYQLSLAEAMQAPYDQQ